MSGYVDESIPYGPIQVIMIVLDHKPDRTNQSTRSYQAYYKRTNQPRSHYHII